MKSRVAYCAAPRPGGVFSHFRTLREAIAPLGWEVRAVSAGQWSAGLWQDAFADNHCVRIAEHLEDPMAVARAFCDWCVQEDIRIVYLTAPDYSLPVWDAVRHLPPEIRAISSAHGITPFSYRSVVVHPERLSALVASSRRQEIDMKRKRVMAADRIHLIPHAVHAAFPAAGGNRVPVESSRALRLGYAGRIVDADKGVFLLPGLMQSLTERAVPWQLEVVGSGPDEDALRDRFARADLSEQVTFHGRQPRDAVAAHMAEWDVFLMPSYHEGFGIALIEAMATGAVPIAHRIREVTDWIVEDGRTGYIVKPGDTRAMADRIARLHADRAQLREMSRATRETAIDRFAPEKMAQAYDALFTAVMQEPALERPLPWESFKMTRFRRSWFNSAAHAFVPRAALGRAGQWIRKFTP